MATQYTGGLSTGQVLTAATMNSIGAVWEDWTPVATPQGGAFTTVSTYGRYAQIQKIVIARFSIQITNKGSGLGSVIVTLPVTAQGGYNTNTQGAVGSFAEWTSTGFTGTVNMLNQTTTMQLLRYDWASPIVNGTLSGFAIYEAA